MRSISLVFLTLLFLPGFALSEDKLEYARIAYSPIQNVAERLLKLVYERAGIEMEIVQLPAKRASFETGSGDKDGEILRILTYGTDKTGLYRIPYPLGFVKTRLYARVGDKTIDVNQLREYKIAVVKGIRHTNEFVQSYPYIYYLKDVNILMKQLDRGKVDVAVVSEINARFELNKHPKTNIEPISDPVKVQAGYHYINERHTETIKKIESIMKEMTESGELLKLWNQYVEELIQSN
ncbi:substrate-binding periplasmic protein [Vibrio algarum]|uniref:Transporter substrate-binding domain-containing protein n=1 Tax=Vibrio algarum TaxID=3020714 RepID=A0ABT4YXB1_9VIBR|nr:transporter substrate-binding domain-containing protein [Vibrio sp. KJ40-1]MDB1125796.1 transporter substrate-binding domain-containing protein [Vibrio sp. KJ40-1]